MMLCLAVRPSVVWGILIMEGREWVVGGRAMLLIWYLFVFVRGGVGIMGGWVSIGVGEEKGEWKGGMGV